MFEVCGCDAAKSELSLRSALSSQCLDQLTTCGKGFVRQWLRERVLSGAEELSQMVVDGNEIELMLGAGEL
jgi:hypothetical protein